MPVSRSIGSRHGSRQPLQPQVAPPNSDKEIIILSSDDEEPAPRKPVVKKSLKPRSKSKPVAHTEDIIEISSEDDHPHKSTIVELQKQLDRAKREIEQLRKTKSPSVDLPTDQAQLTAQVRRCSAEAESARESKKLLLDKLDDHIICEICTIKMWTPYSLPCGHTFCASCLEGWFSTTLTKHLSSHPEYNPDPPALNAYRAQLRSPNLQPYQREHIKRQLRDFYHSMNHPNYNCPTCRTSVTAPPAESFALKAIVRAVAEAQGDSSPKKPIGSRGKGRRHGGPFDGFFPHADLLR